MSKIGVQQSTLCYYLSHYKSKQMYKQTFNMTNNTMIGCFSTEPRHMQERKRQ